MFPHPWRRLVNASQACMEPVKEGARRCPHCTTYPISPLGKVARGGDDDDDVMGALSPVQATVFAEQFEDEIGKRTDDNNTESTEMAEVV